MLVNCGGRSPAITETEAGDPLLPSLSTANTVIRYSLSFTSGKPVVLIQPLSFSTSNLSSPPKQKYKPRDCCQENFDCSKIGRKTPTRNCHMEKHAWLPQRNQFIAGDGQCCHSPLLKVASFKLLLEFPESPSSRWEVISESVLQAHFVLQEIHRMSSVRRTWEQRGRSQGSDSVYVYVRVHILLIYLPRESILQLHGPLHLHPQQEAYTR